MPTDRISLNKGGGEDREIRSLGKRFETNRSGCRGKEKEGEKRAPKPPSPEEGGPLERKKKGRDLLQPRAYRIKKGGREEQQFQSRRCREGYRDELRSAVQGGKKEKGEGQKKEKY